MVNCYFNRDNNNYKYGHYYFKKYMEEISNLKLYIYGINTYLWNQYTCKYEGIDDWINRIEYMQELIVNANVSSKYQKCFNNKCEKLTNEMMILVDAKIYLEKLRLKDFFIY